MRSTLYTNGSILTMEPGPRPEALLVTDGRIAALGGAATLSALAPDAERRDLAGGALLPAFLDAHSHITALAATMGLCDLSPSTSLHHMADILWTFEEDTDPPADGWILGFGYDHTALAERAHPTRQFLDAALPGRKVLLTHASGHMGVASTAALHAMGITADTPDPEGGKIGREADGRTPSGYLEETAFRLAAARVPAAPQADPLAGLRLAQQIYLSQGITLVQDGLTGAGEFQLLHAAARTGTLAVNVVGYADLKKAPELSRQSEFWQRTSRRLRLGGYKILLDGSPQGRTAWMLEPYAGGAPDDRGYPAYTDGEVTGFVRTALSEGVQLLAHCNGDAACAQFIRCCRAAQAAEDRPVRDIRPVMIHAQLVTPGQLAELKELGILPSFFAAHLWYWGDVHRENLGPRRAASISPLAAAVRLGLPFTLHQDTPVIAPNMLESIWCAVNRITRNGGVLGPEYRISAYEALKAVTVHAAWQYALEGERGSLAPGKTADLVLLDRDPTAVEPMAIRDIRVLETIREGETLYRA